MNGSAGFSPGAPPFTDLLPLTWHIRNGHGPRAVLSARACVQAVGPYQHMPSLNFRRERGIAKGSPSAQVWASHVKHCGLSE
jgi:hypothetical protein